MKSLRLSLLLCLSLSFIHTASAQMNWNYNFQVAQSLAITQNKLILVDFMADWCGPCKVMDRDMWSQEKAVQLTSNLIPLKVDIDIANDLTTKYNVTSIPRVLIITPWGDVVWDEMGYGGEFPYFQAFEQLPEDFSKLMTHAVAFINEKSTPGQQFDLALAYQDLARSTEGREIKQELLQLSDDYFRKVEKDTENPTLALEAEVHQYLNYAYRGKTNKALKKIEKMDDSDPTIAELKSFVKAYCFKCDGEDKAMKKEMEKISNEELLAKLKQ